MDMGLLGRVLGQSVAMQSFDTEAMATLLTMVCKERRHCNGLWVLDHVQDESYAVALLGGIMESMTGWSSTQWGTVLKMVLPQYFEYRPMHQALVGQSSTSIKRVFGWFLDRLEVLSGIDKRRTHF